MKMPWTAAIDAVKDLAGQYIEDKDKLNEINLRIQEMEFGLTSALLTSKTTPKTDAFVKIMIAFKDVILPMLRPLGAACMTGFGMYCHLKGIPLDSGVQVVMDGAFPAWGASRHVAKKDELKAKVKEKGYWDDDF